MPVVTAALIAGGASIAGGVIGSMGQADANAASAASVRDQMAFQERMSDTSYQRVVKDLQAAGLNPMLAYSRGGESTPGGASFQSQNELAPLGQGVASAGQTAMAAQAMSADLKLKDSQAGAADAAAAKANSEAAINNWQLHGQAQTMTREEWIKAGKDPELYGQTKLGVDLKSAIQGLSKGGYDQQFYEELRKSTPDMVNAAVASAQAQAQNLQLDYKLKEAIMPSLIGQELAKMRTMQAGVPKAETKGRLWEYLGKGLTGAEQLWGHMKSEGFGGYSERRRDEYGTQ